MAHAAIWAGEERLDASGGAALAGDGHLVADGTTRTGWRVVDPFLAAWLRLDG